MTNERIIRGKAHPHGVEQVTSRCMTCSFSLTHRRGMQCEVLRCPRCGTHLVRGENNLPHRITDNQNDE